MPKGDFTLEELIVELSKQTSESGGFLRSEDIRNATGLSVTMVARGLRELKKQGRLEVREIQIENVGGRLTRVPAYRVKKEKR